jgi:hypothetical protein
VTRVASWSIDRGRQFELDRTDTGRATIVINDTDGTYDPTNTAGPYYGQLEPLKQAAIALQNPVTENWLTVFRGFVDEYTYELDPAQGVMVATITLVDAFELLTAVSVTTGTAGGSPPVGSEGDIFYEQKEVDARIIDALTDGGFDPAMWTRSGSPTIFSGNVVVQDSTYSPGSTLLEVIQDAADAEFPIANFFIDKEGLFAFHGRFARFDPTTTAASSGGAWVFREWQCGDGTAVASDPTNIAQLRGMSFTRSKERIYNRATATPMHVADADIAGQTSIDATSILAFGIRSWSMENLLTYGAKTGPNVGSGDWGGAGALAETKLFANYIVTNYQTVKNRISQLTFRPLDANDTRAPALWDLMCNIEIGDLITVTVDHPGAGGFANSFFVEGLHYQCEPGGAVPDVTLTVDTSPNEYWADNPFS